MTREEAIKDLKELLKWYLEEEPMSETVYKREAVSMAISALKGGEWIPVNGIEDIPKNGSYWVTRNYDFDTLVEKIRWSDVWRCWVDKDDDSVITKESAEIITAYMPYFEPEPYKAESEGTE